MKKIVIIGGGPAGATAARLLAKNFDVTLIQNKNWEKPCGGGVKVSVFDKFDVPKSSIKHLLDKVFMFYENEKIEIPLKGKNLAIVNRKEFDQTLRELAQEAGAKVIYAKFKKLKNDSIIIEKNEKTTEIPYDVLIGADGVNSKVRKEANLPPVPKTITNFAKTSQYEVKECEFFFDEKLSGPYYAWAFPCGNKTHIGSVNAENFENLCSYLKVKEKSKGYFIPTWEEDVIIQKNNIYFVGDAAAQVMPLSFEGIYYAMNSAEILAKSILENTDYQTNWNKKYLKKFKFMKTLESLNKTKIRKFVVKLHKYEFMKNFSVSLWLDNERIS
jgi:geranylgeranyl reductase